MSSSHLKEGENNRTEYFHTYLPYIEAKFALVTRWAIEKGSAPLFGNYDHVCVLHEGVN